MRPRPLVTWLGSVTLALTLGALAGGCGDGSIGVESGALACSDGVDNDGNGMIDCESPSCAGERVCGCGNGRKDGVEACDDGNADNGDGCTTACAVAACGDGYVQLGVEACDDNNRDDADGCRNDCTFARCGDGVVAAGVEGCDDGNTDDTDACRTDCVPASCGDGAVEEAEACDDGNADDTDACRSNCLAARCGDGVVQAGVEACDDGNGVDSDGCRNDCTVGRCGDGVVRKGFENCDDGNADDADDCRNDCTFARCGDGVVRAGEPCDDGNTDDTDGCRNNCELAACGDGVIQVGVEECDDGNDTGTDACTPMCTQAVCGDGYVAKKLELCDDGNTDDDDGCSPTCQPTLVNASFEREDYSGWVLRESSAHPGYGVWGIGTSDDAILPEQPIYDHHDQVSVPAYCLAAPLQVTAADGVSYAYNIQGGPEEHRMSQDIALPPEVTTLGWSMSYHNHWGAFDPSLQYLAVQLRDPSSDEVIATLYKTDNGDPTQVPMTAFEADIHTFAGTTVRIDVEMQVQLDCFDGEFDAFALR
ncbi:MAG: DUF4215 domain-containing protein [Deltaproteobacteria bacterium]|nr:DUF4215 domain-containing protein [Deltaproteobacteria bacterium]